MKTIGTSPSKVSDVAALVLNASARSSNVTESRSSTANGAVRLSGFRQLNTDQRTSDEGFAFVHRVEAEEKNEPVQKNLNLDGVVQSVPGIVADVTDRVVYLAIKLPNDRVKIGFPRAAFPAELAVFGRAVSFSISESDGFRIPKFEPRELKASEARLQQVAEFEKWLDAL